MSRIPAALALLALLSPTTAMAEPCSPRVELSGDRDAIARVAIELKTLGVVLGAVESQVADRSCAISAMVTLDDEGLAVAVQNAAKRSEGRVVSDPKIAAAWIDSWLRDEIEVASWTIAAPPATVAALPMVTSNSASFAMPAPVATPTGSPLERFGVSAALERSWTEDETTWNGFDLAACMRAGAFCVGGRLRAVFQDDLVTSTAMADRSDVVALATASIPFTVGQVSIAPEIGLGVGRMRTTRVEACTAPPPMMPPPNGTPGCSDPMDPNCTMNPDAPVSDPVTGNNAACFDAMGQPTGLSYVGDNYDKVTYLPRAALAVRLTFGIARHVWLDALASYTLTPITPRPPDFDPTTMEIIPDPTTAMPVEPTSGYQLGVGIRVGIP